MPQAMIADIPEICYNNIMIKYIYVHINGDNEAHVSYKVTDVMMPLAHVDVNNPDILSEVKHPR